MSNARKRTAFHELGHAVVGASLGLDVARVELLADDEGATDISSADHLPIEQRMAIALAGATGGDLSAEPGWDQELWDDSLMVVEMAEAAGLDEGAARAARERAYHLAYETIGANRQLMQDLASRLMETGRLSEGDIVELKARALPRFRE